MRMNKNNATVLLLRHAHAAWPQPGERDFDRRLTEQGRKDALQMAERLKTLGLQPARVVCSPAVRCHETLAAFETTWETPPEIIKEADLYDGDVQTYAEIVSSQSGEGPLMIVGHNPMIEDIFLFMADGQIERFQGYPPAALAILQRDNEASGDTKWHLAHLLQPGDAL